LGHASTSIDLQAADGRPVRLLTDPVLGHAAGPLARFTERPKIRDWAGADAVLLSHLHHDHADLPSLRRLRGVPVFASPGNARWLARHDLTRGVIEDPADGEDWRTVAVGVEVRLVRADHFSRPMPHRPNQAHGFLIRTAGVVIWFAGDTSLYPDMTRLGELAGRPIDVALVPIGGWGPRLSPGHLGPTEAAEAVARSGAAHVVPIHYGTLHPRAWPSEWLEWLHAPLAHFVDVLPAWSSARLHPLAVGQEVDLAPAPEAVAVPVAAP
jgi:L-ascorbate metabolism protein UlaG (beta-lactamase superfamily)